MCHRSDRYSLKKFHVFAHQISAETCLVESTVSTGDGKPREVYKITSRNPDTRDIPKKGQHCSPV